MNTYIVVIKSFLEIEATDQANAVALAEEAARRTRFSVSHKMVSVTQICTPQADAPETADGRA